MDLAFEGSIKESFWKIIITFEFIMKLALLFINFLLFPFDIDINCLNCSNQNSFSVLLITETKGWVHDSIESGIDLIVDIGDKKNFNVYHSDDSKVITTENLKEFNSIIFLNLSLIHI